MKIFTFCRLFICILLFFTVSLPEAKAQLLAVGVCDYEDPQGCFYVAYETVQEASPTSTNLVVVISAFLNQGGSCNNVDGLIFAPVGGLPITRTRAQLAATSFVELTVNRALFTATPDIIISTYRAITIPIFGEITFPTEVVDLQARIDGDNACLPITPLPVELISFDGTVTDNGVELAWSTASEQNNSHFEVERSAEGSAFEQVGKVDGHGNSNTRISYSYTDGAPLPGQSYYRLKQVDENGQYEYSKVIAVTMADNGAEGLQVTLAPNPCQNGDCQLRVRHATDATETRLELADLAGRVLYTTTIRHGSNRSVTLPMQELQAYKGLYMLSAISGNKVVRQRVLLK